MKKAVSLIALVAAMPAFAQNTRALDAHEHGVGTLNIAIDGTTVAMAFEAPGADIVGFEYQAKSDADLAAIDAAIGTLSAPLDLFVMPDAASCRVVEALAELKTEDDHDDHDDHAEEGHDDHDDHDDHAEEGHDDHDDHDDHAEEGHDDHDDHDDHAEEGHDDHDDHAEKDHDDHDHDDHAEDADEGGHTEFHAEYTLSCDNPDAVTEISFAYFEAFPNALEVEVQIITASGAQAFEVERDAPVLKLER